MGVAAREIERDVMGLLHVSGCRVIDKGHDGSGHRTVTFEVHQQRKTFHYGSTPHANGCYRRNLAARLRKIIRDVADAAQVFPTEAPPIQINKAEPTYVVAPPTPKVTRWNKERLRALGKRYLTLRCHKTLATEMGLSAPKVVNMLRSLRGEPARLINSELARNRTLARREQNREAIVPKTAKATVKAPKAAAKPPTYALPTPIPVKRGPYADNFRRNIQITRAVYIDRIPLAIIADHFGISLSRVGQVSKENWANRNWKFD